MPSRVMIAVVFGAVLFALVLALCGCSARGSNQTMVPSQVREAIAKDDPGMAFIPGRLPSGYHYATWNNCRNRLCYAINFSHGSVKNQVELQVQRRSCPHPPKWPAKDTHTLHVNGQALKWLQSDNGPIVWRCMTNQGRSFVIFGLSFSESRQKAAELVGYALPAH
jgi:hypothetical protein